MPRQFLIDTNTDSDDALAFAMAIALNPSITPKTHHCFVATETTSPLCRGQPVFDHLHVLNQEPNAEDVTAASRE